MDNIEASVSRIKAWKLTMFDTMLDTTALTAHNIRRLKATKVGHKHREQVPQNRLQQGREGRCGKAPQIGQ